LSSDSWQKVTFDQICKNVSKRIDNPKESEFKKFVGLEHLDTLDPKISRWGSTSDVTSSMTLFKNKQILFGRRNWYLRRVAVADFDGLCSGDIYVLESINGKIIKDFLPLLMHSDEFFEKNMMYSHGSMSTRVKWSNLAKLEFLIPSIPEQENIVLLMQKIDETISNVQKLLEKTKNYAISRRESLLTKGIGQTKFKKEKWYYEKTIKIPEDWRIRKISEIGKVIGGGTPDTDNKDFWNGDIFWVVPQELTNFNSNFIEKSKNTITKKGLEKSSAKLLQVGTILLTTRATIGECVITKIPICTNQGFQNILCNDNYDNLYILYLLRHYKNILFRVAQGTTFLEISKKSIENLELPCSENIDEQQQIACILSNLDEKINRQRSYLTDLKILRKSILNSRLTMERKHVTN